MGDSAAGAPGMAPAIPEGTTADVWERPKTPSDAEYGGEYGQLTDIDAPPLSALGMLHTEVSQAAIEGAFALDLASLGSAGSGSSGGTAASSAGATRTYSTFVEVQSGVLQQCLAQ